MIIFSTLRSFFSVVIGLSLSKKSSAFTTSTSILSNTPQSEREDQAHYLGERCKKSEDCEKGVFNSWCSKPNPQSAQGICICQAGFQQENNDCVPQPFYAYSIVVEMFAGLFGCLLLLGALGYCFKKMRRQSQRDMRHGYIPYSPRDQENLHRAAMLVQQIDNQSVVVALARNYGTTREERLARASLQSQGGIILNPLESVADMPNTQVLFRTQDQTIVLPAHTDLSCASDDSGLTPSPICPSEARLKFEDVPPPYVDIINGNEITSDNSPPGYEQVLEMNSRQDPPANAKSLDIPRKKEKRKKAK